MREMINYVIEANIALLLFLAFYKLLLEKETNFRFLRAYLLASMILSVVLPLIHLNNTESTNTLSIGTVVPEYWLPEIKVSDTSNFQPEQVVAPTPSQNVWQTIGWVYIAGIVLFSIWLIMQLGYVVIVMANAKPYRIGRFKIIESTEDKPTFSFFNLIYIGKANELDESEKQQIIRHETIHAKQLHSIDILLSTLISTVFWFNPLVRLYKRHFIQIHEFEADARAVENSDVNNYCSLLARVALQSHFPIASHFNESLTVKRIEMMRTLKKKIVIWKFALIAGVFALCFVAVACNEQVVDEFSKSTISPVAEIPAEVKKTMDDYLLHHPEAKLTYMEGAADDVEKFVKTPEVSGRVVYEYALKESNIEKKGVLLSDIVQHADALQTGDQVFMVVEQMPEYPGGMDALKKFFNDNIKYPADAKKAGNEGTVYVSMVIGKAGEISNVEVKRGVTASIDAEAVRVVKMLPAWKAGMQNGKAVKCRFIVPISFATAKSGSVGAIEQVNEKMKITFDATHNANQTKITGTVKDQTGENLPGVNVIIAGTTTGISTDLEGKFALETSDKKGTLVFSFVGFGTQEVAF